MAGSGAFETRNLTTYPDLTKGFLNGSFKGKRKLAYTEFNKIMFRHGFGRIVHHGFQ